MTQDKGQVPEELTGDKLREIARSARTSASDSASPEEYVLAGWRAAQVAALTQPAQPSAVESNTAGALPAHHTDNAPLGYTIHEKSAWSVGYEEGYRASHGQAPAEAAPTELVRLAKVAISECNYAENEEPQDWLAAAMRVCRAVATTPSPQAAQQAPAGATECRLVSHQDLKALAASINGDCYMGEEWEKACVTGMLAAPAAPSTPASPTVEGESK